MYISTITSSHNSHTVDAYTTALQPTSLSSSELHNPQLPSCTKHMLNTTIKASEVDQKRSIETYTCHVHLSQRLLLIIPLDLRTWTDCQTQSKSFAVNKAGVVSKVKIIKTSLSFLQCHSHTSSQQRWFSMPRFHLNPIPCDTTAALKYHHSNFSWGFRPLWYNRASSVVDHLNFNGRSIWVLQIITSKDFLGHLGRFSYLYFKGQAISRCLQPADIHSWPRIMM